MFLISRSHRGHFKNNYSFTITYPRNPLGVIVTNLSILHISIDFVWLLSKVRKTTLKVHLYVFSLT